MASLDQARGEQVLRALGEQLDAAGERFELVVIGGSGLLALGLIERATRDVDVVALLRDGELSDPRPLPSALLQARDRVRRDFGLASDWLNAAHDPSEGFRIELLGALAHLGVEDADLDA